MPNPTVTIRRIFTLNLYIVQRTRFPRQRLRDHFLSIIQIGISHRRGGITTINATLTRVRGIIIPNIMSLRPRIHIRHQILSTSTIRLDSLNSSITQHVRITQAGLMLLQIRMFLFTQGQHQLARFRTQVRTPRTQTRNHRHYAGRRANAPKLIGGHQISIQHISRRVQPVAFNPQQLIRLTRMNQRFMFNITPNRMNMTLQMASLTRTHRRYQNNGNFNRRSRFQIRHTRINSRPLPRQRQFNIQIISTRSLRTLLSPTSSSITRLSPRTQGHVNNVRISISSILVFLQQIFNMFSHTIKTPIRPTQVLLRPQIVLKALSNRVRNGFRAILNNHSRRAPRVFTYTRLQIGHFVAALNTTSYMQTTQVVETNNRKVIQAFTRTTTGQVSQQRMRGIRARILSRQRSQVRIIRHTVAYLVINSQTQGRLMPANRLNSFTFSIGQMFLTSTRVNTVVDLNRRINTALIRGRHGLLNFRRHQRLVIRTNRLFTRLAFDTFTNILRRHPTFLRFGTSQSTNTIFLFRFMTRTNRLISPHFSTRRVAALTLSTRLTLPTIITRFTRNFTIPKLFTLNTPTGTRNRFIITINRSLTNRRSILTGRHFSNRLTTVGN